jgi:CheY-like chemotaxis protein
MQHRPGRVLLVEDNDDDAELTMMALSRHGLGVAEVVRASDGAQALEAIDRALQDPELALPSLTLLDLKLPRRSGLEVLRDIRAGDPTRQMPVVVLTASAEPEDTEAAYRLNVNAYLKKPLDRASFVDVVGTLAQFWLEFNELPEGVGMPRLKQSSR